MEQEQQEEQENEPLSARAPLAMRRTNEIVNFMKGVSIFVDAEKEVERLRLNCDNVQENQLMFLITRMAVQNAPVQDIYKAISSLKIEDIVMLNLNLENLQYFITTVGSFFYARSIMRLISKKDILEIQELLGPEVYKHVVSFGKTDAKDDYPLKTPFKERLHAAGYMIFKLHFDELPEIVRNIAITRIGYEPPEEDMSYLKISKDYGLHLIGLVQKYILKVHDA